MNMSDLPGDFFMNLHSHSGFIASYAEDDSAGVDSPIVKFGRHPRPGDLLWKEIEVNTAGCLYDLWQ